MVTKSIVPILRDYYAGLLQKYSSPVHKMRAARNLEKKMNISYDQAQEVYAYIVWESKIISYHMSRAKGIIFSPELMLEIMGNRDNWKSFDEADSVELPFPHTFFQFGDTVPFLDEDEVPDKNEAVAELGMVGILVGCSHVNPLTCKEDGQLYGKIEEGDYQILLVAIPLGNIPYIVSHHFSKDAVHKKTFIAKSVPSPRIAYRIDMVASMLSSYLNRKNVVLEAQGGAPEKVNRKRERQGKKTLEPYYICKIVKVQPSETHATGEGSEHGHRYDVRGHDRHYKSGKVVRIRPHQRGLKHDTYIPKTYVVEKERENGPTGEE